MIEQALNGRKRTSSHISTHLYTLGKSCGGNCEFLENGVKSCMNCGFPHHRKNYDKITSRFQEIVDVMAASNKAEASDEM